MDWVNYEKASNACPKKRALKPKTGAFKFEIYCCFKRLPKEEGTETHLHEEEYDIGYFRFKRLPKEEGTETPRDGQFLRDNQVRFKRLPKEEGTETKVSEGKCSRRK